MDSLPPRSPGDHSLASSGYHGSDNTSQGSIPASISASASISISAFGSNDSIPTSVFPSNDSIPTSFFSSNDSLYSAARHAMDRPREVSEAVITLDDQGLEHREADIPATPTISEARATITDSPVITMARLGPPEPVPALACAPLVRTAVDALLADCAGPEVAGNAGKAIAASDPFATALESPELCLLGDQVRRAIFDQAPAWHEAAATEIAGAAARLATHPAKNEIELLFVHMPLTSVIESYATRNGPYRAAGDNGLLPSPILAQSDMLDRVRRLRDADDVDRRKLDAALEDALGSTASPGTRRVAHRIVDMVAEMAHESFRRRVYNNEIETLLTPHDGNIDALHRAFTGLYALDRYFASPYLSGVDRCLALIRSLPGPVQEDFVRTFTAAQAPASDDATAVGLRDYRDALESGGMLPGVVTERLQADQRRLMTDLFTAAAILRGGKPASAQASDIAPEVTRAALLSMPPPPRRTLRDITRDLWRRIRPSTRLERSERRVIQAIKQHAAFAPPTRAQWKALEATIQDVVRLQRPPAQYDDVVQACVRTLTPAQCVALHDLVNNYEFLKVDGPNGGARLPAERRRHLLALDAALAREAGVRRTMQAVRNAVDALRSGNDRPGFVNAIETLSASLDQYAPELPDARILCDSVLKRLALPSDHIHKALASLKRLQAQTRLEDNIKASPIRTASHPRLETISLMPTLHALEAALERQAALSSTHRQDRAH